MKNLAVLLIFDFVLVSGADAQSLRIATYNLNWGNRRGDQVIDAIETADADIVCFQETTPQSERFLKTRLAARYPYFHAKGYDGRHAAERFAFASNVKLDNVTFYPPEHGVFGFYTATCEFGGDEVRIMNVHLAPYHFGRVDGIRTAMAALSGTEERHAKEIDVIVKAIDISQPTIVIGDFNSLSDFNAKEVTANRNGRFLRFGEPGCRNASHMALADQTAGVADRLHFLHATLSYHRIQSHPSRRF